MNNVKNWYEESYKNIGIKAQRRYPNEELLRFLGVNFFDRNIKDRSDIKVLEVGCGSCSNLWMIARENFDTYGLDLSEEGLLLGQKMLDHWQVEANLKQGSFLELPYEDDSFDVVVDVFSINCVEHDGFLKAIKEVHRVLKKGGMFFSYTPSQNSDAFKNYELAKKIDDFTLNGIYRESSPFSGNHYPFHFWENASYRDALIDAGFSVDYLETVRRSYYQEQDNFEHIVVYARK